MSRWQYRGYVISPGPCYTPDSRWQFVHEDYDGAPNEPFGPPADPRFGYAASPGGCRDEIDFIEDELIAEARRENDHAV